jgi:hypothetical protein
MAFGSRRSGAIRSIGSVMAVITCPDEEELYLLAILEDPTGLDLAELFWQDHEADDGCYRAWDYQWPWYMCQDQFQVDQGGRSTGKTVGIQMRACSFPFVFPGGEMLVTAPELNHLQPLTAAIEGRLISSRLLREMLPDTKGRGVIRNPHWEIKFNNGTRIISRLPGLTGKGVKGQHVVRVEMDEAQNYPNPGWVEIIPTLKRNIPGNAFYAHGVPTGVRGQYYEVSQDSSNWTVHRPMGFMRPSWTPEERADLVSQYGGSRQNIDYKRNVYGDHGDMTHSVFVLSRLIACVDIDDASFYNNNVYTHISLIFESIPKGLSNEETTFYLKGLIDPPGEHKTGWSQKVTRTEGGKSSQVEIGATKGYSAYFGGMDVGVTNHPSEILIFGQREDNDKVDLLLRVNMQRIDTDDQKVVIEKCFEFYGSKLKWFALDKSGVGFPIWNEIAKYPGIGSRIMGIGFSEKRIVAFEDREMKPGETWEDLGIQRSVIEQATDWLRNNLVDSKRLLLPNDNELIMEFQGQSYTTVKDTGDPYGRKRIFSGGSFHTLDAAKMFACSLFLPPIEERLAAVKPAEPILDVFIGGMM